MNTVWFITVIVLMNIISGTIIAFETSENRMLNQAHDKFNVQSSFGKTFSNTLADTSHLNEDQTTDKRAGNEFTMTFKLGDIFKYGFASWFFVKPNTVMERVFVYLTSMLNSFIIIYSSLMLFWNIKSGKTD